MTKLNNKLEFKHNFGDREVIVETGRLAKQTDGSAFVTCGGTQVLATVVSARSLGESTDFFPLLVDYKEKFYAAGKFLGGFMKREGRPSSSEILLMRMIDRPFRPLFPSGYKFETIIQTTVHSYDPEVDPGIIAGIAASCALSFSDVPFNGPVGFCRVGRVQGKLVLNPTPTQMDISDLDLIVAGTLDAVLMIEGEAKELSEEQMVEAIIFGHEHVIKWCTFMKEVQDKHGKAKRSFEPIEVPAAVLDLLRKDFKDQAQKCLEISQKHARQDAVALLSKNVAAKLDEQEKDVNHSKLAQAAVDELLYEMMRHDILRNHKRIGGRGLDVVRPIETEVDILKNVHGSSLFTRGETQVMATITLGGKDGEQMKDDITGISYDRFYLHYTFAPYCVGEAKGYRGVGRREIGHGNLAERALKGVIPPKEKFPYTVRVNCEVTESNGSSSMGSVCSGSMALMDAGVPVSGAVAGVAMGLIKEGKDFVILTDILGDEDHLGDMDFKVAGTKKGITAIQMDIKIAGIGKDIFQQAMEQARKGRLHILGEMAKTLDHAKDDYKDSVPRIDSLKIDPDKIGALIGPSGKNIKAIQENFKITVEVSDDGTVNILGTDKDLIKKAKDSISLQINGPLINSDYDGIVVSIKEYGAFVDIAPNVSGLLHVSEIADERIGDVNDYLTPGQTLKVRVVEVDRFGKIKLSAKAIQKIAKKSSK